MRPHLKSDLGEVITADIDKRNYGGNNRAMDWWAFAETMIRRIPFEKFLVPPRDQTQEIKKLMTTLEASEAEKEVASRPKAAATTEKPKEVAYSGSTGVITREGVDAERMAWQDGIIRGELWLLEGHLKNDCVGCGGDLECCFKHAQNIIDAARETQSMTTEPLYRDTVRVAEHVQPFVHPEDIKAGKFVLQYPALAVEVSQVRTQFDKRVIGHGRPPITLEEAKKMAAEEAMKEVERRWPSQEKK